MKEVAHCISYTETAFCHHGRLRIKLHSISCDWGFVRVSRARLFDSRPAGEGVTGHPIDVLELQFPGDRTWEWHDHEPGAHWH